MSTESNWKPSLGFAERLSTVIKIQSSYQKSDPRVEKPNIAKFAKEEEQEIYDSALTLVDYRLQCDQIINNLKGRAAPDDEEEESLDTGVPEAIHIGKYVNAVHFRDGLYSDVYKAPNRTEKPKMVALKVTYPSAMQPPHNSEREIRILRAAASEHVVSLLDVFRDSAGELAGTRLVLVFPLLRYDLDHALRHKLVQEDQAKQHLKHVLSALDWIHNLGMIHRDVKPSNILLQNPSGPAYLADFGVAWYEKDPSSEPSDHKILDVGTTHYRPPELLFGNSKYTKAIDLWAAGCVLAEIASIKSDLQPLFDCTEGSELCLISSIFQSLGTPTADTWPEAMSFPNWGSLEFVQHKPKPWSELLPSACGEAQDLISKLIRYQSSDRITAAEAAGHAYFG
ncbi:serine/threonine-protein kinase pctaire-3 [Eremomyces bilateralis CBS 781.70]|uniref:cyclin-dependent kinase n=1 Tax=Eremomyces bilateralis CBS 781.70 TaxID=1392243 RepID=A0A6G1FTI1_9PEZI|nr:serine/threonine-protein kinase pctaire-3 [Eremomyces bilateralis CBS 781.70]KAF1809063.1 serine/threonine-protein kinase pctaire-3 [Eremomyces bilateralis CBS 781.70]